MCSKVLLNDHFNRLIMIIFRITLSEGLVAIKERIQDGVECANALLPRHRVYLGGAVLVCLTGIAPVSQGNGAVAV